MKESLKKEVRERAKNCCEYCFVQAKYSGESFSIEHIIPLIKYFTEIIGISPSGRARVNRLQLNRDGLVNLRRVLVDAGLHPPF